MRFFWQPSSRELPSSVRRSSSQEPSWRRTCLPSSWPGQPSWRVPSWPSSALQFSSLPSSLARSSWRQPLPTPLLLRIGSWRTPTGPFLGLLFLLGLLLFFLFLRRLFLLVVLGFPLFFLPFFFLFRAEFERHGAVVEGVGKRLQTAVGGGRQGLLAGVQHFAAQLVTQLCDLGYLAEFAYSLGHEPAWFKPELTPGDERRHREREAALLRAAQHIAAGQGGGQQDLGSVVHGCVTFSRPGRPIGVGAGPATRRHRSSLSPE